MAPIFTKKEIMQLWCRLVGKYVFIALALIILCPIPILVNTQIGYMVFTIVLMGTYWVTEVIPLPVTALIPMVLFPIFGIQDTGTVIKSYFHNVHFLIFGGLVLAAAIEHQNFHRRFALRVLLLFGTNPRRLLLGFMSATAFLSAWMCSAAVTAMMLPIARAVLDEIAKQDIKEEYEMEGELEGKLEQQSTGRNISTSEDNHEKRNNWELSSNVRITPTSKHSRGHILLCKAVILCIPYAANVGGTGSLVGTPPNIICVALAESLFGKETGLNFGSWTLYCFPQMIICILVIWVWLQFMYLPRRFGSKNEDDIYKPDKLKRVIQRAYDELGPIRFAEWAVLVHFLILVVLWITQDPKVFPGWGSFFEPGLTSATPAILITISLFMFPSERPQRLIEIREQQIKDLKASELGISENESGTDGVNDDKYGSENHPKLAKVKSIPALITWDVIHEKMPWGVLLVVGGGFALADGCVESGLSAWMTERFEIFYGVPPFAMAFITAIFISLITEFTANPVTATIFLPIVAEMAVAMRINPLYLMVTAAVSASFAFMLPVATPPNAIAFSSKEIKVIDMVKTGCLLNLVCICVLLLFMNTLGRLIFNIAVFPDWANSHDVSGSPNTTDIYNLYNSSNVAL